MYRVKYDSILGITEISQYLQQFLIGVFASLGSLFRYDVGVIGQVIAPTGNVMKV
jgi:hypothetical protein